MSKIEEVVTCIAGVIDGLNLECEGKPLKALIDYAPDPDFAKIRERKIYVTPEGMSVENVTRGKMQKTLDVTVGIVEQCSPSEVVSRITFAESILQAFMRGMFIGLGHVESVAFDTLYDVDALKNKHVFVSIINVTVVVYDVGP